jgi:hypothetical protein
MMHTVPRYSRKRISLRLANGECFVVTAQSWKKFLVRLENNCLTRKRKSYYPLAAEEYWNDAFLQAR